MIVALPGLFSYLFFLYIYLEFVKYQLGFHKNVQVFVKCTACIAAIQSFYIQICPGFLSVSKKSYIFLMLELAIIANIESVLCYSGRKAHLTSRVSII